MRPGYDIAALNNNDSLDEWDHFVDISPQGSIFCRSWWLRAVCPNGFRILILREGKNIIAGMPLPVFHRWRGRAIIMPHLTQTLGILLAKPTDVKYETRLSKEMEMISRLLEAMPEFGYYSINFHYYFTNWLPFYWLNYKQTTRYTYIIEDLSDLPTVFDNLSPKCRNRIRKSVKCGVSVTESDDIDLLLELNRKTYARQGLKPPYSADLVKRIDAECAAHEARKIFLTVDEGRNIHSALYVVYDKKSMYCLIGGSDSDLRDSGANYLAIWHSIEFAREVTQRYDFEGSMMPNVEPVLRLFGAVQTPYFCISKDDRPMLVRAAEKYRGVIKNPLHLF